MSALDYQGRTFLPGLSRKKFLPWTNMEEISALDNYGRTLQKVPRVGGGTCKLLSMYPLAIDCVLLL